MKPVFKKSHRRLVLNTLERSSLLKLQALASQPRLRILDVLANGNLVNFSDISKELNMPMSTTLLHINKLQQADLIHVQQQPSTGGVQKLCSQVYNEIILKLPETQEHFDIKVAALDVPIGTFTNFDIVPTCGLASEKNIIGLLDDPISFYEPNHHTAQLLWFKQGFVEYTIPNKTPKNTKCQTLSISMEICSEAPMHHNDWPSDITLWIDDIEIGTWTSPADFGGERGFLTPQWWSDRHTQFGLLKEWKVASDASYIDGFKLSDININDLKLSTKKIFHIKIGIKKNAKNIGGINLFGSKFGNYKQDILLHFHYQDI